MTLTVALADHDPLFICDYVPRLIQDGHEATVRDVREEIAKVHHESCGCPYGIEHAWIASVDKDNASIALKGFSTCQYRGSRLVSHRAHLRDAFPSLEPELDGTIRLIFSPDNNMYNRKRRWDDESDDDSTFSDSSSCEVSKRPKLSGLSQIHGSVFRHSESRSLKLASASSDFCNIMEEHALYVDKSLLFVYMDHWKRYHRRIPFISRPRGFGMRTFLSSIEAMYDISKPEEQYEAYLDALAVVTRDGLDPYCAHNCLVLRLDLAHPSIHPENLDKSLKTYVENQIAQLFSKYASEINGCQWAAWSREPAGNTIFDLAVRLKHSGSPDLYLIIENATAPLLPSQSRFDTQRALASFFTDISLGQYFCHFAGIIATAYLEEGATINTHFGEIFSGGYVDVTNHPYAQGCFGFTRSDIEDLVVATAGITKPDSPDIWETLRERGIVTKQWSRLNTTADRIRELGPATYSMKQVLQVLAERCGQQNAQPLDNI